MTPDATNYPEAGDARYGVYLPCGKDRPLGIVPLCMQPSLGMEREHGPFAFAGMIEAKEPELREWMQRDAAEPLAVEALVTDREHIRSIRGRTIHADNLEDQLLACPGPTRHAPLHGNHVAVPRLGVSAKPGSPR